MTANESSPSPDVDARAVSERDRVPSPVCASRTDAGPVGSMAGDFFDVVES